MPLNDKIICVEQAPSIACNADKTLSWTAHFILNRFLKPADRSVLREGTGAATEIRYGYEMRIEGTRGGVCFREDFIE